MVKFQFPTSNDNYAGTNDIAKVANGLDSATRIVDENGEPLQFKDNTELFNYLEQGNIIVATH